MSTNNRTGLSQADAEKRVNDVVTQVKADLDAARKAAMQIAIWYSRVSRALSSSLREGFAPVRLRRAQSYEVGDRSDPTSGHPASGLCICDSRRTVYAQLLMKLQRVDATTLAVQMNRDVVSQAREFVWGVDDGDIDFVRTWIGSSPDRVILTEAQRQNILAIGRGLQAPNLR